MNIELSPDEIAHILVALRHAPPSPLNDDVQDKLYLLPPTVDSPVDLQ